MDFRVLGPLEVDQNGQQLRLQGSRQRRLLGVLLLEHDRVVRVDRLADIVWDGDGQPDSAIRTLRTYVTRLRQALGDVDLIQYRDGGYVLALAEHGLDRQRFEDGMGRARRAHDATVRVDALTDALNEWRGPLLGELSTEPWVLSEAARLDEMRATAEEDRADARLSLGHGAELVAELEPLLDRWPRRDHLRGIHMLALYRGGRAADALASFQAHRRRLIDEAGLEPGPRLQALEQRIVANDPTLFEVEDAAVRRLRSYQLGEVIGEGAFSLVYRGTQPSVGRAVAVKQIRAELANRPEFIRRFEAEAQMVARLEHPHIVPLYDYWREPDTAFLVMRWLRGGTLEQQVSRGRLDLATCGRLVSQVGSALAVAHRSGVVHRDVKPANVLLDGEGNFFLSDFGIALEAADAADPSAALSAGSPAYASPEQLRREPVGPEADVHGLAIATFEALTGQLPFPAETDQASLLRRQLNDAIPMVRSIRTDVPEQVDAVLQRATAKRPSDRYHSVEAFMEAFDEALAGKAVATARRATRTAIGAAGEANPYRGLEAFQRADAPQFFGRDRLVDELVEMLRRPGSAGRLVTVVGPSGSGKSSVVRAGLLPALERGAVPGSGDWFVTTMVPGDAPFESLETALLRIAVNPPEQLLGQLTADARGVGRAVKRIVPDEGRQVLLLIDQFEEVFTLCDDLALRRRFLEGLATAVSDPTSQLRVILTLRADFYDRPLRHAEIAGLIKASTVTVAPLAPDELERAIVDPAESLGAEFEPGLVSEIVAEVADQPGALPMLQYALTELWETRVSGLLTRDAYRRIGGVAGALAAKAEEVFASCSDVEQGLFRRVFGQLVSLGEGVEDTRRRMTVADLEAGADGAMVGPLLDRLGNARLVSFDRDPVTREPTVEVAHEALIREWSRLREWLDADRDGLRLHRQLGDGARGWAARGREAGELLRGGRLEQVEGWAGAGGVLSSVEAEFLAAAVDAREREAEAERARFEQQARSNQRLRRLLAGVGIALVVAMVAGVLAFDQRSQARDSAASAEASAVAATDAQSQAEEQAFDSETGRLVANAASLVGENRDLALLMAAEAHRRDPGPETLTGLQRVLANTGRFLGQIGPGHDYVGGGLLADGTIVGVTNEAVEFYDSETWELLREVPIEKPPIAQSGAVSTGGMRVAIGTGEGSVLLVRDDKVSELLVDSGNIGLTLIDEKSSRLAVGSSTGDLHLFDLETGKLLWTKTVLPERSFAEVMGPERFAALGDFGVSLSSFDRFVFGRGPRSAAFTGNGRLVVTAGPFLRALDLATGEIVGELLIESARVPGQPTFPRALGPMTVTPDGELLAVAGASSMVWVDVGLTDIRWGKVPTGRTSNVLIGALDVDAAGQPWFGLTNGLLVSGDDTSGSATSEHFIGLAAATSVVVLGDGRTTVVAGVGGMVAWSIDGSGLLAEAVPAAQNTEVWISADGGQVIASNLSAGIQSRFYERGPTSWEERLLPADAVAEHEFFNDIDLENRYFFEWSDGWWYSRDRTTYERGELSIGPDMALGQDMSHDGKLLAGGGQNTAKVHVIELENNRRVETLDLSEWVTDVDLTPTSVAFDADDKRLLVSLRSGTSVAFSTINWKPVQVIESSDHGGVVSARFSRDGSVLAARSLDGLITIRDVETFEVLEIIEGGVGASEDLSPDPHLSADGEWMVTVRDSVPRLWHVPTETLIGTFPHDRGLVASGNDRGNELRLVTLVEDNVMIWNLNTDEWPDIACRAAGRNMTQDEWDQLGPKGEDYRATCDQWPAAS